MKIKNEFAPKKTDVDLSETEIEFISMLTAGVEKKESCRNSFNDIQQTKKTV